MRLRIGIAAALFALVGTMDARAQATPELHRMFDLAIRRYVTLRVALQNCDFAGHSIYSGALSSVINLNTRGKFMSERELAVRINDGVIEERARVGYRCTSWGTDYYDTALAITRRIPD